MAIEISIIPTLLSDYCFSTSKCLWLWGVINVWPFILAYHINIGLHLLLWGFIKFDIESDFLLFKTYHYSLHLIRWDGCSSSLLSSFWHGLANDEMSLYFSSLDDHNHLLYHFWIQIINTSFSKTAWKLHTDKMKGLKTQVSRDSLSFPHHVCFISCLGRCTKLPTSIGSVVDMRNHALNMQNIYFV